MFKPSGADSAEPGPLHVQAPVQLVSPLNKCSNLNEMNFIFTRAVLCKGAEVIKRC